MMRHLEMKKGASVAAALMMLVSGCMLGVTIFGLLFTPVFYVVCQKFARRRRHASGAMSSPTESSV